MSEDINRLTRKHTAFNSFTQFVRAGYQPTLNTSTGTRRERAEKAQLAYEFDLAQAQRGSDIRAYRG